MCVVRTQAAAIEQGLGVAAKCADRLEVGAAAVKAASSALGSVVGCWGVEEAGGGQRRCAHAAGVAGAGAGAAGEIGRAHV